MPAPHSNDLRQRVIDAYIAKAGSQRQLADRFQVSLSFVQRLVRRYQKTGQVTPLPHAGGATPKVNPEDLSIVQQLVDEQPDAILSELCERLANRSGIQISSSTMYRAVQRLELTTKKKLCMPVNKTVHALNRCALSIVIGFWALTPII